MSKAVGELQPRWPRACGCIDNLGTRRYSGNRRQLGTLEDEAAFRQAEWFSLFGLSESPRVDAGRQATMHLSYHCLISAGKSTDVVCIHKIPLDQESHRPSSILFISSWPNIATMRDSEVSVGSIHRLLGGDSSTRFYGYCGHVAQSYLHMTKKYEEPWHCLG